MSPDRAAALVVVVLFIVVPLACAVVASVRYGRRSGGRR